LSDRIYLDHAATTPLRPEVLEAMLPWLGGVAGDGTAVTELGGTAVTEMGGTAVTEMGGTAVSHPDPPSSIDGFGNANALYREGRLARQALEDARERIAATIGARPTELVFTSGGTEANNAALIGIPRAVRARKGREKGGNHVLTSAFEHHAVLEPVQALRRDGWQTTLVRPKRDGFIHTEDLTKALRDDTTLVTIMAANNELGTVQPLAALAALAHERGALFFTDAVQMLGKLPLDVRSLGLDAASFSAHKIGGPKGMGALYLKGGVPFLASMLGGGQEGGRRSGTQNVAGAIGFAQALAGVEKERDAESARLTRLRDHLTTHLTALDSRVTLTVPLTPASGTVSAARLVSAKSAESATVVHHEGGDHLPHILSLLVAGFESETLILALDEAGFAVSGGAACSTGSLEPSHVLLSLGLSRAEAYGVLRLSLGHDTTHEDCEAFIRAFAKVIRAHLS
jgi:cysteine desulfurase